MMLMESSQQMSAVENLIILMVQPKITTILKDIVADSEDKEILNRHIILPVKCQAKDHLPGSIQVI